MTALPRFTYRHGALLLGASLLLGWFWLFRPEVSGDGGFYLQFLKTTFVERYPHIEHNKWPMGMPLWNAGPYLLLHQFMLAGGDTWLCAEPNGWSWPYVWMFCFSNSVFGMASALVMLLIAAQLGLPALAGTLLAALGFWATPVAYYTYTEPTMSHAVSTLGGGLIVLLGLCRFRPERRGHWVTLGLVSGLTTMVRWQDVLVPALVCGLCVVRAALLYRQEYPALLRRVGLLLLFGTLGVGPQLFLNWAFSGNPLDPRSYERFSGNEWNILLALFAEDHGLFVWHPLFAVGVLAALWLAVRPEPVAVQDISPGRLWGGRWLWWGVLGVFAVNSYANGMHVVWWAEGFGDRRFLNLTVPLLTGLAVVAVRWRRPTLWLALLAVVLIPPNLLLLELFRVGQLGPTFSTFAEFRLAAQRYQGGPRQPETSPLQVPADRAVAFAASGRDLRTTTSRGWKWGDGLAFASRHGAELSFTLPHPADYQVSFITYLDDRLPLRQELSLNGRLLASQSTAGEVQQVKVRLPVESLRAGLNRLQWSYPRDSRLLAPSTQRFPIGQTGVLSPVAIAVESSTLWDGFLTAVRVGGTDYSIKDRGYSVVAVEPRTGKVLEQAVFPVFHQGEAAEGLRQWLERQPSGTIIAVALRDIGTLFPQVPPQAITTQMHYFLARMSEFEHPQDKRFDYDPMLWLRTVAYLPDGSTVERDGHEHQSSTRLRDYLHWLEALPQGSRVTIFPRGREELATPPELSAAFALLGAVYQTKLAAAIGVRGAEPGTAIQAIGPPGKVLLTVGNEPWREEYIAATGPVWLAPAVE